MSGFNIQNGVGKFLFTCLSECARILFMRLIFYVTFLGYDLRSLFFMLRCL
jgi:hypothetical protein